MKISKNAKNALYITLLCSLTYLAVYFAKNILSAVSPQMLEAGVSSQSMIGTYSSVYFICYAVGQLINGMVGDKIKARYMICFGVILAGVSILFFINLMNKPIFSCIAYGLTGIFLSMIFGPITKLVAENTEPIYAPRCSVGYNFAAYLGSPFAGLAASFLAWNAVFYIGVSALIVMGCICFVIFLVYEKKGIIKYNRFELRKDNNEKVSAFDKLKTLVKHDIIRFVVIAIITGVVRTAVVFWLPVYLVQNLGFSSDASASIFTVATMALSLNAFISVFVYEKLKRNMNLTILLAFTSATVMFLLVYFVKLPVLNIIFLILAVLSSNCAASMLWSRYCPSLRETGLVSTATGFLDFTSYMAASAASSIFANAVTVIGWGNLILVWCGLMIIGFTVAFPAVISKKSKQ